MAGELSPVELCSHSSLIREIPRCSSPHWNIEFTRLLHRVGWDKRLRWLFMPILVKFSQGRRTALASPGSGRPSCIGRDRAVCQPMRRNPPSFSWKKR